MNDKNNESVTTGKPLFTKTLKRFNKPKLSLNLGTSSSSSLASSSKTNGTKDKLPHLSLNLNNNKKNNINTTQCIDGNSLDNNDTTTGTIDLQKLEIFTNNNNNNGNKKKSQAPPVPSKSSATQQSLPGTPTTILSLLSNGADSSIVGNSPSSHFNGDEDDCEILLDDLVHLGKIGAGNSGTVMKVLHVPTQIVYAKKIIPLPTTINKDKSSGVGMSLSNENQNKQIKLQIKRELEIMDRIGKQDENSNIVTFKNAFYNTIEIEELVTPLHSNNNDNNDNTENEHTDNSNNSNTEGTVTASKMAALSLNSDNNDQQQSNGSNSGQEIDFYSKNASIANEIVIIMEYMNLGSLDRILQTYKEHCRRCNVKISPATSWFNRNVIISRIAHDVLNGLAFLYDNFKIIHRDIKPSNILLNSKGRVKICDFGVSKNTVNSIVDTFVGTSTYMSPERIQGGIYTTKGDVWSLGLSIIELLTGKFPLDSREIKYDSDLDDADNSLRPDGILDLLQRIVNEPSPHLPTNYPFNEKLVDFVNKCCIKNPDERASIKELLQHEYIQKYNFNKDPKTQERYTKDFKKYCKELKKLLHDEKVIKRQKQQANMKR